MRTVLPVSIDMPISLTDDFIGELGSRNPQYRFETTPDGRLIVTPGTGFFASVGEAELIRQVTTWNFERNLGCVSSSSGYFRLKFTAAVKGPDCTYTSWASIDAQLPIDQEPKAYEQFAPDATFELMSPTDDLKTLDAKCRDFVANGISVVVLLILQNQSVGIYRPHAEPVYAADNSAVTLGPEMSGFVLNADFVFAASMRRRPNT